MGGPYLNEYKYDEQNRLTGVSTPSSSTFPYDFNANYSLAGRFGHGFCGNTSGVADENSRYGYDDHRLTHQPRVIFDYMNNRHTQLAWDANGNLALLWMCDDRFARFHDWNDENRLRMVVDDRQAGYYGYDANGERVYKLVGGSEIVHTGPELTDAFVRFDTVVLYPNPYVTITPGEYTKHYYAGNERLATVIGRGGWCYMSHDVISAPQTEHEVKLQKLWHEIYEGRYPFEYHHEPIPDLTSNVDIDNNALQELQYRCPIRHLQQLSIDYRPDMLLEAMYYFCEPHGGEDNIFYTHGDHLGSASWITDYRGMPIQYMHYLPYGQLLANQRAAGYDERYKFTGKERDAETGYDFFGARYWWFGGTWLSVDPLADKYPHISPYAYCNWNPLKYVDPDGRDVWELSDDGTIKARIRDKTQDAIAIKGKSISFDYGTIDMGFHGRERNNTNYTYFQFAEGKENEAAAAFKFLADNSSVEYALVNTDKNVSGVYTNRNKDYVYSGFAAARVEGFTGAKMTDNYHSHPNGTMFPSGLTDGQGDMRFAKNKGDSYNYYIYPAKSNGVIEYFSDGSYISVLQPWPYKNVGTISPYVRQSGVPALLRRLGIKL